MGYPNKFRFWCQTVLPLVYDDSLSYYELLNKVVKYLNNMVGDVTQLGEKFIELKNYVDSVIDEAEIEQIVTEEVDRLINEMIDSGEFDDIVERAISQTGNIIDSSLNRIFPDPDETELEYFAENLETMRYERIIALYDELPGLEKHLWGVDDFGNNLLYYTYKSPALQNIPANNVNGMKTSYNGMPHLLIVSGMHGIEKGAVVSAYLFIKEMINNPEKYGTIMNSVGMTIVPVINPSGFNNHTYNNGNNVNVNRNFPNNFSNGGEGGTALSQPEARFVANLVDTLQAEWGTSLFVVDCHEFLTHAVTGTDTDNNPLFWFNCSSDDAYYSDIRFNLFKTSAFLQRRLLSKYPELTPSANNKSNKFYQISWEPTFESYFAFKGCAGFLCESMSQIFGGTQYTKDVLYINYTILSNCIYNTLPNFKPNTRKIIRFLEEIGCTTSNTLEEVMAKIPYRSDLYTRVSDGTTLHNSLPKVIGDAFLKVTSVSTPIKLVECYGISGTGNVTPSFINLWNNGFLNDWQCMTTVGFDIIGNKPPLSRINAWLELNPFLITFADNAQNLKAPTSGLLIGLKVPTDNYYDHRYLILIKENASTIYFCHFRADTTEDQLVWYKGPDFTVVS